MKNKYLIYNKKNPTLYELNEEGNPIILESFDDVDKFIKNWCALEGVEYKDSKLHVDYIKGLVLFEAEREIYMFNLIKVERP